ncbi:hypothetical protein GGI11_003953 [Coemansia sp. RSA 2049]|nr:hypothetical protein GGI11_003953 [Coemansia sp. RSA 2049]KAJ2516789.1 hypothetical protein H4217_004369 [Coemansia sp. RSA 1939]KAJ2614414.1 hypothetical protein EV177_002081 [Coemansia sp. RSA 1804]KAJ2675490.1 hypothetical protein GGH99_005913 [Coemansia sp. RSA 1285]
MDDLFDKLDKQVESALATLFPATADAARTGPAGDAQQRAQEFANQVALVHTQLAELKRRIEEPPAEDASPAAALEREIADLRQDIGAKNAVLAKHRAALARFADRLRTTDDENRRAVEGAPQSDE